MFKCVKRIVTHAGTVFVSFFIVLSDNICVVPVNPGTITMMLLISLGYPYLTRILLFRMKLQFFTVLTLSIAVLCCIVY